jgi:ferritin
VTATRRSAGIDTYQEETNMMSQKIQGAFNSQINAEFASAYIYLSMAAWAETRSFRGMAKWMRAQAHEELLHASKFYEFVLERNGQVTLTQIAAPRTEWGSPLEAFEDAYAQECRVSGLIDKLVDLTIIEKDHAANAFLQWFVTEQVEEEAVALEIVDDFKLAGDQASALFILDRELGQRSTAAEDEAGAQA